jgi:hypothetical protein
VKAAVVPPTTPGGVRCGASARGARQGFTGWDGLRPFKNCSADEDRSRPPHAEAPRQAASRSKRASRPSRRVLLAPARRPDPDPGVPAIRIRRRQPAPAQGLSARGRLQRPCGDRDFRHSSEAGTGPPWRNCPNHPCRTGPAAARASGGIGTQGSRLAMKREMRLRPSRRRLRPFHDFMRPAFRARPARYPTLSPSDFFPASERDPMAGPARHVSHRTAPGSPRADSSRRSG